MPHKKNCQCPPCRFRRGEGKGHSPRLSVRLDPAIREYLVDHKDGARAVIEDLVEREMSDKKTRRKAGGKQSSDNSSLIQLPGALELWSARFGQALKKTKKLDALLASLGLLDLKGRWVVQQLGLGYCNPRAQRADVDLQQLEKLGMLGPDGREVLTDCLTVPYLNPMGAVAGFYGISVKNREEDRHTGPGSGLLNTGALAASELVLVDGVRDALACFGAGLRGVQALELLTSGWYPELGKRAGAVALAIYDGSRAESVARELKRLDLTCRWVEVPEDEFDRQMVFQDSARLARELKRGRSL